MDSVAQFIQFSFPLLKYLKFKNFNCDLLRPNDITHEPNDDRFYTTRHVCWATRAWNENDEAFCNKLEVYDFVDQRKDCKEWLKEKQNNTLKFQDLIDRNPPPF